MLFPIFYEGFDGYHHIKARILQFCDGLEDLDGLFCWQSESPPSFTMPSMALASSIYQHYHFQHRCHQKHIHRSLFIHTAVAEKQNPQKPDWELHTTVDNPIFLGNEFGNRNANYRASLLQDCNSLESLKKFHARMLTTGLDQHIVWGTKLVNMYAKLGSLEDARVAFGYMRKPNVFACNAMVAGYAREGQCREAVRIYYQMQWAGLRPDKFTFPFVLKASAGISDLQEGKKIHCCIVRIGCDSDVFVGAALVHMYAKCGTIEDARQVFDKMPKRDLVSWNVMLGGYAQGGHSTETLALFNQMLLRGLQPNPVTVVNVLPACARLGALQQGKWIHSCILKNGFDSDVFVGNSLIDLYAKCSDIKTARQVFDKMCKRDVVSWNAIIAGYAQNGRANEVLILFHEMQLADLSPDPVTMVSILSACAQLGALEQGKWIHDYIIRSGFESDVFVGNSLIDMYSKCGNLRFARQVFDKMPSKDVVSWNAIIGGYAQNGHGNEAITLFHQMELEQMTPDSATVVSVLSACSHLGALQEGKWIHDYVIRRGFVSDIFVGTALIDMYAKCGRIEVARQLFVNISNRNVASWNALIAGYGMHGCGKDALELFSKMLQTGMKPDHITFTSVLSACSHAGLVDEGRQYFDCMSRDYCITPRVKHYACMVDLLGRAGHLDEAHDFIKKMPLQPDASVWGALLGACRVHHNIDLGEVVAKHLFDLEPENAGYYVLLSNIYAVAGRWDNVAKVRTLMKDKGLKKTPGWSLIELNNRAHEFLVGNNSHPESEKIYGMLETLAGQMKEVGYVPETNFALHDVEEEEKENILCIHSEKLAIAYGLISTSPGTRIQIIKNLRVCGDCHNATKLISKIVGREIIVRDANRFHYFKDGLCSCRDYW